MMPKLPLLVSFLLVLASPLLAQQLPFYTQYRHAQAFINPASVNADFFLYEYNVNLNAAYRAQWISNQETPRTMQFSGEYITDFGGAFELVTGMMLFQDRTGPMSLNGAYGRIGSLFTRDPYFGAFGVGFSFGMAQYRVEASRIVWKDPDDPNIPLNDISVSRPDLGCGLFYYKRVGGGYFYQDNIYFGLSVPQILSPEAVVLADGRTTSIKRVPHAYFTSGWYHYFNQDAFLELSLWSKYVQGAPLNLDLNARFQPGRTIWFGAGGNINGMVHLEGGLNIPELFWKDTNFRIGYSFDYSLSAFGLPLGTSHEINIALQFDTY